MRRGSDPRGRCAEPGEEGFELAHALDVGVLTQHAGLAGGGDGPALRVGEVEGGEHVISRAGDEGLVTGREERLESRPAI